jgi:hypothetical protein
MLNPELLTAYGVAGIVVTGMLLTALKIVRDTSTAEPTQRSGEVRRTKAFWPPLAPVRR